MVQRSPMETVRINVLNKNGTIYISSDDVPGLWLWGNDTAQVFDSLIPALKALYEYNRGVIVDIKEAPARTRPGRWFGQSKVCETYEVFKVGNASTQATA